MYQGNLPQGYVLVIFEPIPEDTDTHPLASPQTLTDSARHLEEEISYIKGQLSLTVEQYEASTEEHKASNEELQAINEELRSATEELETSKEELQSINEELVTVNYELKSNIEELSRANSDLQNLMASTEIGTIFLDRQLKIKRFTPRVQELFNLIPGDIGRSLSDITHKLNYTTLTEDAEQVLHNLRKIEREIGSEGRWFLGRMLPYRTSEDRIDGVVLTFVEISELKRAEEARVILEREVAVLEERNHLSQDLHDTLAQGFTAIKLQIEAAEVALPEEIETVEHHLSRAREIAQQSLVDARQSIRALRSSPLDGKSLGLALDGLREQVTDGVNVRFEEEGDVYPLTQEVENEIFRIGQEALTNALRHSLANEILIGLRYLTSQLQLRIVDNGQGFDMTKWREGYGVTGMYERAARLGGELKINSNAGKGTEVILLMPYLREQRD